MTESTKHQAQLLAEALGAIRTLRQRVRELEAASTEPIAIVGMGCRLPGGINSPDEFWTALEQGRELLQDVPGDRWENDVYYDPNVGAPGKICTRRGGFVASKDRFDATFFRISPREAVYVDPQHRLLLEVAWEALEHANIPADDLYATDAGVFVGISSFDYVGLVFGEVRDDELDHWAGTGSAHSAAAGRISYALGLHGPSLSVDTACSSSLVAVHLACESLRRGECSVALAGGVNMVLSPLGNVIFSRARMLSPDGRCKTFDDAADGYARSEGAGLVVLKKLSKAIADGNRVLSVIRGAAVNQDGPSGGLTVPNGPAQRRVILSALSNAGVAPADVGYIEAHGTGTPLGDPVEINALGEVFRASHRPTDRPLFVGSAKTNLGHTEAAAGIAGLIKLVLQLERASIVPHLHLKTPNRRIPWKELPLRVPAELVPWPRYGERRVGGVSSFGFTGTNAHVIVEEPPAAVSVRARGARSHHLLCLSARSEAALSSLRGAYAEVLKAPAPAAIEDVCQSANAGRSHFEHRLAAVVTSAADGAEKLIAEASETSGVSLRRRRDAPQVGFLFAGQGVRLEGAGRELYKSSRIFRDELSRCDAVVVREAGFSIVDALYSGALSKDELAQTKYSQPLSVSLQLALAALFRSFRVEPAFVMGHSLGEYTAACVAGIFSVEDTLKVTALRGRLMQELAEAGCMVALECSPDLVEKACASEGLRVSIAAVNAPTQTVISGAKDAVEGVLARLSSVQSRRLEVSHAFHSPLMQPMLASFNRALADLTYASPAIGFVSNLTGGLAVREPMSPDYWSRHLLEPVQFLRGMKTMHESGCNLFVEIGARPTLLPLGLRCLPESDATWLSSLDARRPDWEQVLGTAGALYTEGVALDFRALGGEYGSTSVTLPSYPFERRKYWFASGTARRARTPSESRVHPLLGRRTYDSERPDAQHFESELSSSSPAYLGDHQVLGRAVFPAAGYVELALAAARALGEGGDGFGTVVSEFRILTPLTFEEGSSRCVRTVLESTDSGGFSVAVLSRDATDEPGEQQDSVTHAELKLSRCAEARSVADESERSALLSRLEAPMSIADAYRQADLKGLHYGPAFRALRHLQKGDAEALATFGLTAEAAPDSEYVIHPVMLDAAFQAMGPLLPEDHTYLPEKVDGIQVLGELGREASVHLKLCEPPEQGDDLVADLELFNDARELVVRVRGLRLKKVAKTMLALARDRELRRLIYEPEWRVRSLRAETGSGEQASLDLRTESRRWLLFCDEMSTSAELERALLQDGDRVIVVASRAGSGVASAGVDRYTLDPERPEHYVELLGELEKQGQLPSNDGGVVYLGGLDVEVFAPGTSPSLTDTKLLGCGPLLNLVQALVARAWRSHLSVVTRGAFYTKDAEEQVTPEQAALAGLLTTLTAENATLRCRHIDLDPMTSRRTAAGEAMRLKTELVSRELEERVAFRSNRRLVARLAPLRASVQQALEPVEVYLREYGSADHLALRPAERREPGPHEIEIEVRAAGLNFKDVLQVWGLLKEFYEALGKPWVDRRKLGFECAGRVARVGSDVSAFAVGDEVVGLGFDCLSSFVTLDAASVVAKPKRISHAQAAALPTAYLTAVHGLVNLAGLRSAQKVLVHAAAGGVGQAAVELCRQMGAEVFATASPGKWDLLRAQGIEHVMNSRTLEFEREVLERTNGEGVNIVLNSLTGEFIPAGLRVLARGGTFVEIGKRGIWSPERVLEFRADVRYFPFDLGELEGEVQRSLPAMLRKVCQRIDEGQLGPLPVHVFPVTRVGEALRTLAEAKSVGKVVVEFPERGLAEKRATTSRRRQQIRSDASYLVTGGLGALGLEVASWLARHGARHLALVGRRPPDEKALSRLGEIEASGAQVEVFLADVAGPRAGLEGVLNALEQRMPPLRGIVHAAGTTDDGLVPDLTWERLHRVMAPKVVGAWALHDLTKDLPLDFFVAFSSAVAWLGSPGQANYAAANSFLDALMQHRRALGLPGLSIGWGPWASVGMAARLTKPLREGMQSRGLKFVSPSDNLSVLGILLDENEPHALVARIQWATYLARLNQAPPDFLRDLAREHSSEASVGRTGKASLGSRLAAASGHERRTILMDHVRSVLTKVLRFPESEVIEPRRGLFDLGMDSLSAMEIKNSIEHALGCAIPTTALLDFPTLEGLVNHLHDEILGYAPREARAEDMALGA